MSNLFFEKYATLKSIQQVWKASKAYTNAIPDNLGFWNGTHLTIDNLPDGNYILKYSVDSREYEEQTEITVAGITKVELKLPDSTNYIVVYSTTGELMGRIRTSARYGINVDGATSSSVVVLANESGFITTTVAIGNKVEL